MLQQTRELSSHDGTRAFALALAAAALVAIAAIGGYEVGTGSKPLPPATTQPVTFTQDAPPITGFQP
jgi:hypothetical protein